MKETSQLSEHDALEKAAKYICNLHDGLCPMVVEKIICKSQCTMETVPWHCWMALFIEGAAADQKDYENGE
jgi:hypothetical protein